MSRPPSVTPSSNQHPEASQQTLSLIRRVLCPHAPPTTSLENLLPALTSSSDVDNQLYAFVAIICRDFVLSWYSNITTDHVFIDELIAIIAHCTRALEERLRKVDLEALLLDEIPTILERHVRDYRESAERQGSTLAPHMSLSEVFRNFQPHPAMTNSPESERLYLKLLSTGILAVLLPTEDLESDIMRSLVREILVSMVFGNLLDRISEPFTIYGIIVKVLQQVQPGNAEEVSEKSMPERVACPTEPLRPPPWPSKFDSMFSLLSNAASLLVNIVSKLHHVFMHPLPSYQQKRTLLRSALPGFLSTYLHLPLIHPWLPSSVQLLLRPFSSSLTRAGKLLDDLLVSHLRTSISASAFFAKALETARAAVFPNGSLGPPRADPSQEEKRQIRRAAEEAVVNAMPQWLSRVYFSDMEADEARKIAGRLWLDVWGEQEINKVLIYRLVDLVVGRVLPELLDKAGAEIRRMRVGGVEGIGSGSV